ncbi:hypothetical protein LS482_07480 [Sinomicrobium kalidii]|uniref:hypothetical protein n=1 Tax=Sinomicrobium kalidii TaxID=2900738 RepID=UPI001E3864E2|nr:hypothetical protein [Sinomicrobium kalidii]UGU17709.1 hypothetical protein LS482_07480 [Sinomicrobium kalidii]
MKKAIRYLRYSHLGQSNSFIERQEFYTDEWVKFHKVELTDTFIDRVKVQEHSTDRILTNYEPLSPNIIKK